MLKKIENVRHLETVVIILILLVLVIYTVTGFVFTSPKDIHYEFPAIKYQIGNPEFSEDITVEIDGKFKRKLWGFNDTNQFEGSIIIDGVESYSGILNTTKFIEYKFNEDGMSSIINDDFEGHI